MSSTEKCQILSKSMGKNYTVHLRGSIQDFDDYSELYSLITNITSNDTLSVYLNTPGGDCSVGFSLAGLFLGCKCPIAMIVEYPTYSMGSIIALCGDELHFSPNTYLMFHDYSGGAGGKGEDVWLYTDNYRKVFKEKFKNICSPFLSHSEISKMFKGEDIYIHHDDPLLEQRLKKHFK